MDNNILYKCTHCKIEKPRSDYHNASRIKRGFAYYCKVCQNGMTKKKREERLENGPTVIRDSKVCFKCKNLKPVSQFSKNAGSADGYTSYCKPCWVAITQKAQARQRKS